MQPGAPLTSAGFLAAQCHESWGRSAAVGVGRQAIHECHSLARVARSEAVIEAPQAAALGSGRM
jgi:hypothetical protein